jgi:adenylate kinase
MKKVIFISGSYGSGKSTLCKKKTEQSNFVHISASKIITDECNESYENSKSVKDVQNNQDVLIEKISELSKGNYLLDGHFVIMNNLNTPEVIKIDVFKRLELSGIILVLLQAKELYHRLKGRDSFDYSINQLEVINRLELETARKTSKELSIPLRIIYSKYNEFEKAINEILE